MSDVVAAAAVAPRDSSTTHWSELLVQPSAGRFRPGQPVALFWEIYNLTPDTAGIARYEVSVRFTVGEIERRGFAMFLGGIADAAGLSAEGDDEATVTYRRDRGVAPGGRAVEYLSVDLRGAPEATYMITVAVTDLVGHHTVTAERPIAVTRTLPTR
jgi:hypothetical protein